MVEIVDTGTILYQSDNLDINIVLEALKHQTKTAPEIENNKYIFRNSNIYFFAYINFITVSEIKKTVKLSITYSYSRFKGGGNYEVCKDERTIRDVHTSLTKFIRAITGKIVKPADIKIIALDISNQLSVENIRNYYTCLDLIYRALKDSNTNGRLYFDTDENKRKQLDGLDFRDAGKKRREASSYFKIYSKRKEEEATGKNTKGHAQALRGELTLKGAHLKKWGLDRFEGITRENLERVLKCTMAETIISGINAELEYSLKILTRELKKNGSRRIKEFAAVHEYHIFDIKILDLVIIPKNMGVQARQCRNLKKQVIEMLELLNEKAEIKKTYNLNFSRLKKLLKKIVKADVTVELDEEKGARLIWQN